MAKLRVVMSVDDANLKSMRRVAKAAEAAGLEIESQLRDVGVVTGLCDAASLARLRDIAGVQSVEIERQVGIAPPGKKIQ